MQILREYTGKIRSIILHFLQLRLCFCYAIIYLRQRKRATFRRVSGAGTLLKVTYCNRFTMITISGQTYYIIEKHALQWELLFGVTFFSLLIIIYRKEVFTYVRIQNQNETGMPLFPRPYGNR